MYHLTVSIVLAAFIALAHSAEEVNVGGYLSKAQENVDQLSVHCFKPSDDDTIYKYSIPHLNESQGVIDFAKFKGKPLLLVNVATFCQSASEYPVYNKFVEKYGNQIEIVGFPSNQFWNQEPSANATEIYNAIRYVRPGNGFVPKFALTKLVQVNGAGESPIFSFFKRSCLSTRTRFESAEYLLYAEKNARDVRWNFEKFLLNHEGHVYKRFDQHFKPEGLIPDIEHLIAEAKKAKN